ncbi:MAG: TIGR00730 family Rossman fold protein [Lachnospiraceae bacterium]|jgi:uncharacterized protein (TIGR00730 family)|nr:TIGR00730 family Rossman fold protein [Lachnospiraceae bacterium]
MKICVYLGASFGESPKYRKAAEDLGRMIAETGNALVYGGSRVGLMGVLAESVLSAGGEVTGVEPQFFIDSCVQHEGLTRLIATKDMAERKQTMIALSDAFLAFPGGTGTLEEISEVISLCALGRIDKPYVFYNLDHYYDPLFAMFDRMTEEGFVTAENRAKIQAAEDLAGIRKALGIG